MWRNVYDDGSWTYIWYTDAYKYDDDAKLFSIHRGNPVHVMALEPEDFTQLITKPA
jgi:hypothetical protein